MADRSRQGWYFQLGPFDAKSYSPVFIEKFDKEKTDFST